MPVVVAVNGNAAGAGLSLALAGDIVFAAATCDTPIDPLYGLTELGAVAANVIARAIARGVYEATALPFAGALPSWKNRFATE